MLSRELLVEHGNGNPSLNDGAVGRRRSTVRCGAVENSQALREADDVVGGLRTGES